MTNWHSDTHRHGGRNTINVPPKKRLRARTWCFTLNNYDSSDPGTLAQHFLKYNCVKYIFQEEIGENKTPHLQGVVNFKNPLSFSTMKKINNTAHWEVCKNLKASINYCSKEDTRSGEIYSYGTEEVKNITTEEIYKDLYKQHTSNNVYIEDILPNGFFCESNIGI